MFARSHEMTNESRRERAAGEKSDSTRRRLTGLAWWMPVAALSLLLALIFVDPFAGDWDALDYTVFALEGRPSSMLLGRMLFVFFNHGLWRIAHGLFDLPPERAYLLFKYAVVAQSPLAIIASWALARELTRSVQAATLAALLLALSPFYIIYSGQAMTEIPAILLLAIALTIHLRGLERARISSILIGAALLGLGANVREAALVYAPWLVFMPCAFGWRWRMKDLGVTALACLLFVLFAFGPFALWFGLNIGDYRAWWFGWWETARAESARHPISLSNMRQLLFYFFIAAPVVLSLIPWTFKDEWRRRGWSPLLIAACVGLWANLILILHYSVVLNGRYLLTGLPALVPITGDYLWRKMRGRSGDEWRAFWRAAAIAAAPTALVGSIVYIQAKPALAAHALPREYRARLELLPPDAVVMAGGQTVSVTFWRGVGLGRWEVIGTGSGWPGPNLPEVIDSYLRAGKRVFVDTDPRLWKSYGWQEEETRALVALQDRFRFRRVTATIYEIRPRDDLAAQDDPQLWRLLPERGGRVR
jgi:4-amino-4-deoxy-L-arabinose transferase-like glycosyltransferase